MAGSLGKEIAKPPTEEEGVITKSKKSLLRYVDLERLSSTRQPPPVSTYVGGVVPPSDQQGQTHGKTGYIKRSIETV